MLVVPVVEPSQVADARRRAAALASAAGAAQALLDNLALVVTELATNLLKHGGGGDIVVVGQGHGVDVLALDHGAGMHDIQSCMADGYSTSGTPGNGLGAVRRLSTALTLLSWPGVGTAVLARLGAGARDDDVGAVIVPKAGEDACGDAWSERREHDGRSVLVVDGSGHGAEAAVAAHAAVIRFQRGRGEGPAQTLAALHDALRPTRGAAVAIAQVHWASATLAFAGVGNIAGAVVAPDGVRRLVSHNGIVGHTARRIQAFEYPCRDALLVMHSDGLRSQWSLDRFPGLQKAPALLVAGVLYHHHRRGTDDAAIVVARTRAP